jgi:hypothetical protein
MPQCGQASNRGSLPFPTLATTFERLWPQRGHRVDRNIGSITHMMIMPAAPAKYQLLILTFAKT